MHLYFDCFSGISGDMTLGALVDLGVPLEWLRDELKRLLPAHFDITTEAVSENGLHATSLFVHDSEKAHPMNYNKIRSLIESGPHSESVKERSLDIFEKIAVAESAIHGCPKENVHFHEVGGIDSVADIVGTALCLEYLGVTGVSASKVPVGNGFVNCAHGTIPIPAPATVAILKGVPVYGTDIDKEIVTPTGAAILVSLSESFGEMPEMVIDRIGYGAGKRDLGGRPNLLRILAGEKVAETTEEDIVVIESAIDDMNPEIYGYLMERLFEDGAHDVYWQPIYMKKNRPGVVITALCSSCNRDKVVMRILSETTTTGVKFFSGKRKILPREIKVVDTSFGKIQIKEIVSPDGKREMTPEFEVCKKIAIERKLPLRDVYDMVKQELL